MAVNDRQNWTFEKLAGWSCLPCNKSYPEPGKWSRKKGVSVIVQNSTAHTAYVKNCPQCHKKLVYVPIQ